MTDRTLVLVKPDGVARGLVGEVIARLEAKGLRLVAAELRTLTPEVADTTHYAEHRELARSPPLAMYLRPGRPGLGAPSPRRTTCGKAAVARAGPRQLSHVACLRSGRLRTPTATARRI